MLYRVFFFFTLRRQNPSFFCEISLMYAYPLLSSTKCLLSYFLAYLFAMRMHVLVADLSSMLLDRYFGLGQFLGGS